MLVRLPSSMHVSMSTVDIGSLRSSFPNLQLHIPSPTSLFLSVLVSLVVLAALRAALLYVRPHPQPEQKHVISVTAPQQQEQEKQTRQQQTQEKRPQSSWAWGLITWDSLPALPVSLSAPGKDMRGRGVGLGAGATLTKQHPPQPQMRSWQQQQGRRGPAFERPLPAIYQTEVPASMAKMIMSRHTFRRPASRPPAKPSTSSPQIQIQRRSPSMV